MSKRKTIAADPWKTHVGTNNETKPAAKKKAKPKKTTKARTKSKRSPARQASAKPAEAPAPAAKVQLSLRFDPTLLERVRNACHAQNISLQGVIDQALTREIERMEKEHGGPFAPRPGTLKTGPRPS